MKLTAVFLLGVNLVATSHLAASASDCKDTAAFLQESLGKACATQPLPAASPGRSSGKISHSALHSVPAGEKRQLAAMTPIADTSVRMRPFVPGRYLPSESEILAKSSLINSCPAARLLPDR